MKLKLKVFFDTNVLLDLFITYRSLIEKHRDDYLLIMHGDKDTFRILSEDLGDKGIERIAYLRCKDIEWITFEKCVFEVYMAARGVGGKKPAEGRGSWAQDKLKLQKDPKTIHRLHEEYHNTNTSRDKECCKHGKEIAFYYSNMIEGTEQIECLQENDQFRELRDERTKFENLCNEFEHMLNLFGFVVYSYVDIFNIAVATTVDCSQQLDEIDKFGEKSKVLLGNNNYTPELLNQFARMTILPSEDFEIVYAAERIGVDIFITNDKDLIKCSSSLGTNSLLFGKLITEEEFKACYKAKINFLFNRE